MLNKKNLFLGGLVLLLAACSSTDVGTKYYQLPDSAFRLPEKHSVPVGIKIQLAEPLKSGSLLYQTDAHTLNFAQNNLWAAPLEEALTASLSNKLNRSGSLKYVPAGAQQGIGLTIYLDRFQGRYTGDTEISGYAQWANGQQKAFHVITAQQGDGYAPMTESLDKGLDDVAREIAQ